MTERLVRVRESNTRYRVLAEDSGFLWVVAQREGAIPWTVHSKNVTDLRFEVGKKYRNRSGDGFVWTVSEVLPDGVAVAYYYEGTGGGKSVGARLLFEYSKYNEVTG